MKEMQRKGMKRKHLASQTHLTRHGGRMQAALLPGAGGTGVTHADDNAVWSADNTIRGSPFATIVSSSRQSGLTPADILPNKASAGDGGSGGSEVRY